MQIIDPDHPFYRPLWRRVALVAFCTGWTALELWSQQMFWVVIAGAAAAYSAWVLLITWKPKPLVDAPPAERDSTTGEP